MKGKGTILTKAKLYLFLLLSVWQTETWAEGKGTLLNAQESAPDALFKALSQENKRLTKQEHPFGFETKVGEEIQGPALARALAQEMKSSGTPTLIKKAFVAKKHPAHK